MTRHCIFTGKKPMVGHKVSHANNKTKRRFLPNLHVKKIRVIIAGKAKFIKVRLSAKALRTLDQTI